jgi:hypothetical protein
LIDERERSTVALSVPGAFSFFSARIDPGNVAARVRLARLPVGQTRHHLDL